MVNKKVSWKCKHCGNVFEQKLKANQKPIRPPFCECKHRDWKIERCEFEKTEGGKLFGGLDEITSYNLNQGVFQGHFYFGKKIELEECIVDSIVFDNGIALIDYGGVNIGGKSAVVPLGKNEIQEIGLNYRASMAPADNVWSNKSIAEFCKNMENTDSVVSVGVECNVQSILNGLLYKNINNKKIIQNSNLYRVCYYPTLTTPNEGAVPTPNYTEPTLNLFGKNLLEIITKVQDFFMDVTDRRIFLVGASYVLASYCFELFRSIGYIFFNSEQESGKTKFANVLGNCSFHTINASGPSEPALFRAPELFKGLMLIDDFDKMPEERKNALLQILKIGYKKKGQAMRIERKRDIFTPKFFDCYCPKIITNISGLEPVTLSRCIPIHLMKTLTEKGKRDPDERSPVWQFIRDCCHIYVLTHWKQIQEDYENYECDALNNRDLELVKGSLAIIKGIDSTLHQQMLDFLVTCFGDRAKVDLSGDWGYTLFVSILDQAVDNPKYYSTTQITSWLKEHLIREANAESEQDYKRITGHSLPTTRFVGRHLSLIPLIKKRRVGAGIEYELSSPLVKQYMRIRGYYFEEQMV